MITLREFLGKMWATQQIVVVEEDISKHPLDIEPLYEGENYFCHGAALLNRYVRNYGAYEGQIYICLVR